MCVVNTLRTLNGPPKFCIDLGADWLIILDEVRRESSRLRTGPASSSASEILKIDMTMIRFSTEEINEPSLGSDMYADLP